jgi:hypothetical protein
MTSDDAVTDLTLRCSEAPRAGAPPTVHHDRIEPLGPVRRVMPSFFGDIGAWSEPLAGP